MALQKASRLFFRSLWSSALSPEPFTQAFTAFWKTYAPIIFWGDVLIQGVIVGVVGYISQRRGSPIPWLQLKRALILVFLIVLIEVLYFPSFVQYYPDGFSLREFFLGAYSEIVNVFKWDFLVQMALILGGLKLIPEVASRVEYLFTEIRERWLE